MTFDAETYVEEEFDYIAIADGEGREIHGSPFTADQFAGKAVTVPGATVHIRLITDESENYYGFKVANVRAGRGLLVRRISWPSRSERLAPAARAAG